MRVTDILNLPGWSVTDVEEREERYLIQAQPTLPLAACLHCGKETLAKHGTDAQQIRDLPCHGRVTVIRLAHRRYRCTTCRKTCYQPLPEVDTKRFMTKRLVRYIERKAISTNRTFVSISEEISVDPRTIRNVFDDAVHLLDSTVTFETPAILGIDELHVLGAPRAVFTNLEASTIIELLEDRKKQGVIHALRQFQLEKIQTVVTDLWRPYREAVQLALPHATLVADKFHVLKLATTALENYRKEISASLRGWTKILAILCSKAICYISWRSARSSRSRKKNFRLSGLGCVSTSSPLHHLRLFSRPVSREGQAHQIMRRCRSRKRPRSKSSPAMNDEHVEDSKLRRCIHCPYSAFLSCHLCSRTGSIHRQRKTIKGSSRTLIYR